jgi:hypothetical protein
LNEIWIDLPQELILIGLCANHDFGLKVDGGYHPAAVRPADCSRNLQRAVHGLFGLAGQLRPTQVALAKCSAQHLLVISAPMPCKGQGYTDWLAIPVGERRHIGQVLFQVSYFLAGNRKRQPPTLSGIIFLPTNKPHKQFQDIGAGLGHSP